MWVRLFWYDLIFEEKEGSLGDEVLIFGVL